MKKLLLILAIAILLSCSNDDTQHTCNCDAWVRYNGNPVREVIKDVEINCDTNEPINLPEGYTFLGCDNDNTPWVMARLTEYNIELCN